MTNLSSADTSTVPVRGITHNAIRYPSLRVLISPDDHGTEIRNGLWVDGLVDSGADHSEFCPGLFSSHELRAIRAGMMHTSVGVKEARFYHLSAMVEDVPVLFAIRPSMGYSGEFFGPFRFVIGRDILGMGTLVLERTSGGAFSVALRDIQP